MRKVRKAGITAIDARTRVGRRVLTWREGLLHDLGGLEELSQQQLALVDTVTLDMYELEQIAEWELGQPSLVNRRAKSLPPVVLQRQKIADGLTRRLSLLGLERRTKPVPSLGAYVNETYGKVAKR